MLMLVW